MSKQFACVQCGASYDASIFLPGQTFQCLDCNEEMVVPDVAGTPTSSAAMFEPDTHVYRVPEALSRELPAPREASSFVVEEATATGFDLAEVSEALQGTDIGPSHERRDVLVRGQDTMDREAFESGEMPTVRAAGISSDELSAMYPRDESTNVSIPGPDMLAILTPVHSDIETTTNAEMKDISDGAFAPTMTYPGADEDWDVATAATSVGANEEMSISEEDTVTPAEAREAMAGGTRAPSPHTLHEAQAPKLEDGPLGPDSFYDLDAALAEEESTINDPQGDKQWADESRPSQRIDASPLEPMHPSEMVAIPQQPTSVDMPSYSDLAQVVEDSGPLVLQEGDHSTQIETPVISLPADSPAAQLAEELLQSQPSLPEIPPPPVDAVQPPSHGANGTHESRDVLARPVGVYEQERMARDDAEAQLAPLSPGGFWRRVVAWCIDLVLVYGSGGLGLWWSLRVWPPSTWLQGEIFSRMPPPFFRFLTVFLGAMTCVVVILLLNVLYYGIAYKYKGASVGKALLGLQVRHAHTRDFIGFKQAFLREVVGKFLSVFLLLGGFLMAAVRKDKQSLHDLVFTTQVVRKEGE